MSLLESSFSFDHIDQELLAGQVEILTMIAEDAPTIDTLNAIAGLFEKLDPMSVVGLTVVDRSRRALEMATFPSLPPNFTDGMGGMGLNPPHNGNCVQAIYQGEPVVSEDLRQESRFSGTWPGLCASHGILSCHSYPVLGRDRSPLGTVTLCFREPRKQGGINPKLVATCVKLAELALARRRVRERNELLIGELQHRVSNVFASVGALANMSAYDKPDTASFMAAFEARLVALAEAHRMLTSERETDLSYLLHQILTPYDQRRIRIAGSALLLDPDAVFGLSMAFHELATNAAKYGALSTSQGWVDVTWKINFASDAEPTVSLLWNEVGGPTVVAPQRQGFGVRAVERLLANEIEARVSVTFPSEGLCCTINAPLGRRFSLPAIAADAPAEAKIAAAACSVKETALS